MVAAKKEDWKMGAGSGYITKLSNLFWRLSISIGWPVFNCCFEVVFRWDSSLYIIAEGRESWERFYSDCPVEMTLGNGILSG
jgi:hypothetical protein